MKFIKGYPIAISLFVLCTIGLIYSCGMQLSQDKKHFAYNLGKGFGMSCVVLFNTSQITQKDIPSFYTNIDYILSNETTPSVAKLKIENVIRKLPEINGEIQYVFNSYWNKLMNKYSVFSNSRLNYSSLPEYDEKVLKQFRDGMAESMVDYTQMILFKNSSIVDIEILKQCDKELKSRSSSDIFILAEYSTPYKV